MPRDRRRAACRACGGADRAGSRRRRESFRTPRASDPADAPSPFAHTRRGSPPRRHLRECLTLLLGPLRFFLPLLFFLQLLAPALLSTLRRPHEPEQTRPQLVEGFPFHRSLFGLLEEHAGDLRRHVGWNRHLTEYLVHFVFEVVVVLAVVEIVGIDGFASLGAADGTRTRWGKQIAVARTLAREFGGAFRSFLFADHFGSLFEGQCQ